MASTLLSRRGMALAAVMSLFLLVTPGGAGAEIMNTVSFEDDFEAAIIDPFWDSISEEYGTVSLSADQAHSGTQSLRMQSESGGNRGMTVRHHLDEPSKGTISVRFYDSAPGRQTLYAFVEGWNTELPWGEPGYRFGVGIRDAWCCYYQIQDSNHQTSVPRTLGWHEFTIVYGADALQIFIDGVKVQDKPGEYAFDKVTMGMFGPSWRPNATYYWDDFSMGAYPPDLVEAAIDVKPGSDPNCVNSDGHGVIPVAILSTADFDATEVDPATVTLDGQPVQTVGKTGRLLARAEDITGDGLDDLVVQIQDVESTYNETSTLAVLVGTTFGGVPVQGTDSICLVP